MRGSIRRSRCRAHPNDGWWPLAEQGSGCWPQVVVGGSPSRPPACVLVAAPRHSLTFASLRKCVQRIVVTELPIEFDSPVALLARLEAAVLLLPTFEATRDQNYSIQT